MLNTIHLQILRLISLVFFVVVIAGCSRQVRIDGQWQESASRDQSFSRILVVGVSPDFNVRCDFESFLVTQIRATGADAKASCKLMRSEVELTRETILPVVAEYQADAVLTTVLVQAALGVQEGGEGETRGGRYLKATGAGFENYYTGGFGYYGMPVVYGELRTAPVITSIQGEVDILSMLYATSDASLVYEIYTTAQDLSSRDSGLATITPPIAQRLQREGLIRPPAQ